MVVGTIASSVVGAVHPVSGIFMGKLMIVLSSYGTDIYDEEEYKDDRDLYCILYLVLAILAAIASILQVASWRKVGQGLTYKLREKAFAKIMKMRPDWFDFAENSAGVLSSSGEFV
ncbi:ABC transporter type 1, transmembrane domain [Pseudocohnilembus persalinus]|uniref:ABC transporter type 1, transmembrane domain n=1 Tax=Pseudocohnilembus persalinus TaxID=266149 RepID=A0A0V0Q765_PSEPJ|nr:ABC transporter type 1, transmembrane domain [Pseudocohnilembus persalinus]|eukprot:KRW98088.1 ABC transporter type 1, transmembrane domain [Pseudocohnilembus persalinus]